MERLKKRELERYGDIILTDPERIKLFKEFITWAGDYDDTKGIANRNLIVHENWLNKFTFPILKIEGDLTVDEIMKLVIDKLTEERIK
ncbi:hypothetical protein OIU83_15610 [Flavobacterium sp. LS1R49]|uniref:Uncharacterized protein n=1 Tax=Flavobacterium shii TaxID=2987687 RepID=A0A9X2ZG03_9FLAO|nr:hypothetical protein [Flavobacterium shii]MCV9929092.1 hypothetical protein [Flavobacterium shii]